MRTERDGVVTMKYEVNCTCVVDTNISDKLIRMVYGSKATDRLDDRSIVGAIVTMAFDHIGIEEHDIKSIVQVCTEESESSRVDFDMEGREIIVPSIDEGF